MESYHIQTQFNVWPKTKGDPSLQYPTPQIPASQKSWTWTLFPLPGKMLLSDSSLPVPEFIKCPPGRKPRCIFEFISYLFILCTITSLSCFQCLKLVASHILSTFIAVYSRKIITIPNIPLWLELEVPVLMFNTFINGKLQFFAEVWIHLNFLSVLLEVNNSY